MSYGEPVIRGAIRTALVAAVTLTLLAGCQGPEAPTPSLTPAISATTPTARFASDAEALAAAKRVYKKYLVVSNDVSTDGGEGVERLMRYVTSDEYKQEKESASEIAKLKFRVIGASVLKRFEAQSVNLKSGAVVAYACLDLRAARVLNAAGKDVTPSDRPDEYTALTRFTWQDDGLLLEENRVWSGDSIC